MIWNSLMYHVRPFGGNPKLHIRHTNNNNTNNNNKGIYPTTRISPPSMTYTSYLDYKGTTRRGPAKVFEIDGNSISYKQMERLDNF